MPNRIRTYAELRKEIRGALRRQHPEWIDANGKSPLCDSYEARLAYLLASLTPREKAPELKAISESTKASTQQARANAEQLSDDLARNEALVSTA